MCFIWVVLFAVLGCSHDQNTTIFSEPILDTAIRNDTQTFIPLMLVNGDWIETEYTIEIITNWQFTGTENKSTTGVQAAGRYSIAFTNVYPTNIHFTFWGLRFFNINSIAIVEYEFYKGRGEVFTIPADSTIIRNGDFEINLRDFGVANSVSRIETWGSAYFEENFAG